MKRIIVLYMCICLAASYFVLPRQHILLSAMSISDMDTDSYMESSWHLSDLKCEDIWERLDAEGKQPGEGVVVAVIDTGLDVGCKDLQGALWYNEAEKNGQEGVDDDGNGYVDDIYGLNLANRYHNMTDNDGHGTEMAGIIAMQPGNGGSVGVAYGAKIMPIKVSSDRNYDVDTVIEAIQYAVNMGADVINMSFATYTYSQKLEQAVREASKSCVMVAAAGNERYVTEGSRCDRNQLLSDGYRVGDTYPASWDCCIGVMASDRNGNLANFSNWDQNTAEQARYDIVAPGEQITTVSRSDRYVTYSGTSYATAMVSASVAVLKGIVGDAYNAVQLKEVFLKIMEKKISFYYDGQIFQYPKCLLSALERYLSEKPAGEENKQEDDLAGNSSEPSINKEVENDKTTDDLSESSGETGQEMVTDVKESGIEKMPSLYEEKPENKIPFIKKIRMTKKGLIIKISKVSFLYKGKITILQRKKGKIKKVWAKPAGRKVLFQKKKLRKKGLKNGKIIIAFTYKNNDQQKEIQKYRKRVQIR